MLNTINLNNIYYNINLENPIDISIPMDFEGRQVNTYNVPLAKAKPYKDGTFIGDTRLGGSCNFQEISIIPHCNGTHTECSGHITLERIYLPEKLKQSFFTSLLITITPKKFRLTKESYLPNPKEDDFVIDRDSLKKVLNDYDLEGITSLVIRTLPNDNSKMTKIYNEIPPYFTNEAMEYIDELDFIHLLVDIPSVDRLLDEGKMSNHKLFWGGKNKSYEKILDSEKTITEFIYVKNEINDGIYILNLQTLNFYSDATPSKPMLYKLIRIEKWV